MSVRTAPSPARPCRTASAAAPASRVTARAERACGNRPFAESRLLAGLRRGDATAYEDLVREYSPRLGLVLGRYVKSWDRIEDGLQTVWLAVYRSIGRFHEQCRLGTWLHRVAVNAALMMLRGERRHPAAQLEDSAPAVTRIVDRRTPEPGADEEAEAREETARRVLSRHVRAAARPTGLRRAPPRPRGRPRSAASVRVVPCEVG